MKSAMSRTVLVNLIVNGGLVLQTSLRKNRLIVSYQQISWHLKKRSENVESLKTMAHFLEDSWSKRGKEYKVKQINQKVTAELATFEFATC